jgi:hypothetical protein
MRLRNWIAVVVSVILLAAAGTIGFLVNRWRCTTRRSTAW